jgi:hypothetical protein
VIYKNVKVAEYIPDLICFGQVVVDIKTIERITDHELGQMLNYLRITGLEVGILSDRLGFAAHPEDVILGKLQYYREDRSEKHLRDIARMILCSADRINRSHVAEWLEKLNVIDEWNELVRQVDQERRESEWPAGTLSSPRVVGAHHTMRIREAYCCMIPSAVTNPMSSLRA